MNRSSVQVPGNRIKGTLFLPLFALLLMNTGIAQAGSTDRFVMSGGTDTGDCSNMSNPCGSIGYAVAQTAAGDVIRVMNGTYNEDIPITTQLSIEGGYGAGFVRDSPVDPTTTVIDGGGTDRPITVSTATGDVTLNGLRITNGNGQTGDVRARFGGGILITDGARLSADNIQVDNCVATNTGGGSFGGGICVADGELILSNSLVTMNQGRTGSGTARGGGIYVGGALGSGDVDATIMNCMITNNTAGDDGGDFFGGGLFIGSGTTTDIILSGNTWSGNVAAGMNADDGGCGGAVACDVTGGPVNIEITDDVFTMNIANNRPSVAAITDASGGALYFNSTDTGDQEDIMVTMTNVTVTTNTAKAGGGSEIGEGGGIYARGATVTINGATIQGNLASGAGGAQGGGIRFTQAALTADALVVQNNTATNNLDGGSFSDGGGIQISLGDLILTNSIITDNITSPQGGTGRQLAINYAGGAGMNQARVIHCTLAAAAGVVDAALHFTGGADDRIEAKNNIFTNHAIGFHNQGATGVTDATNNLFFGNTLATQGQVIPGTGRRTGDPAFVNADTGNYYLTALSDAIDGGTTDTVVAVAADIDGESRPVGLAPDIGADEFDGMNMPPSQAAITPALHVIVSTPSIDPESGPVQYVYEWTSNGGDATVTRGPTSALEDILREGDGGATFDANEIWTVTITPQDAQGNMGPSVTGTFVFGSSVTTVQFLGFGIK
jgi:hypothetical protein